MTKTPARRAPRAPVANNSKTTSRANDPPTTAVPRVRATLENTAVRNAVVVLAVVVTGAALFWLGGILTPLALAIFLLIMIDGMAGFLRKRAPFLPASAALSLALGAAVLAFVGTVLIVAEYAAGFVAQVGAYGPRLTGLITRGAAMLHLDAPPSPTLNQLFDGLRPYIGQFGKGLQNFASNALFVLVYLGFLIASRAGFARKVNKLFPSREERAEALEVFQRIRVGVERYLWIQTVTGLIIAVLSWGVMAAVGLDNAFFWAFLIFVAGYIPIIGGAVGCILPPLVGLVQFETFWPALILLVTLNVINFIVGNVILPRMQGDSLNLDPVVVLLALAFWGAIWGLAGMFLSTPLTVMTMVILAQFPGTQWIAVLLSGDGDPLGVEKPRRPARAEKLA